MKSNPKGVRGNRRSASKFEFGVPRGGASTSTFCYNMRNAIIATFFIGLIFLPGMAMGSDSIETIDIKLRTAKLSLEEERAVTSLIIKNYEGLLRKLRENETELLRRDQGADSIAILRKNIAELNANIRTESKKIASGEKRVAAIEEEKKALFREGGVIFGTCYLHGTKMITSLIPIQFGLKVFPYSLEKYVIARRSMFPNSDEPIERGCMPSFGKSIEWMTCPDCSRARQAWLDANSKKPDADKPRRDNPYQPP